MSATELAVRMKVNQSRVSQIERAEESGSIHMSTLIRAAEALECRFVYALVPKTTLEEMVMRQSFLKAAEKLGVDVSDDGDDEPPRFGEESVSELHEVLALEWVDRRGLWAEAPSQPEARAEPRPPPAS